MVKVPIAALTSKVGNWMCGYNYYVACRSRITPSGNKTREAFASRVRFISVAVTATTAASTTAGATTATASTAAGAAVATAISTAVAATITAAIVARRAVAHRLAAAFAFRRRRKQRLAGKLHAVLVVDPDHLHGDLVADLNHLLDAADVAVVEFRDVAEPVAARSDLDERARIP